MYFLQTRYYGEYNTHMYGWFLFGWAFYKDIQPLSSLANKFSSAEIEFGKYDGKPFVDIATVALMLLGL